MKFIILALLLSQFNFLGAQNVDSLGQIDQFVHAHDSIYMVHEHPVKNKIWGNSWNLMTAFSLNKTTELSLNIGRTYGKSFCGGAGCFSQISSLGLGYHVTFLKNQTPHQLASAFWEYTFFYFPPVGVRAEYIYDITSRQHYLRPSLGLSFFAFDILYNYSIKLNGEENRFGHGVTFRIKLFRKIDNWEKHYPNMC